MGILSVGKIIHGAVKVVKGIAEGDGEEIDRKSTRLNSSHRT